MEVIFSKNYTNFFDKEGLGRILREIGYKEKYNLSEEMIREYDRLPSLVIQEDKHTLSIKEKLSGFIYRNLPTSWFGAGITIIIFLLCTSFILSSLAPIMLKNHQKTILNSSSSGIVQNSPSPEILQVGNIEGLEEDRIIRTSEGFAFSRNGNDSKLPIKFGSPAWIIMKNVEDGWGGETSRKLCQDKLPCIRIIWEIK